MSIKPQDMILRCLAYNIGEGKWVAKCIDLNLVTEEDTLEAAKLDLHSMISSYIATVLDTEDEASIPALLLRKGPWYDRFLFKILDLISRCRRNRDGHHVVFQQSIPMHIGASCN